MNIRKLFEDIQRKDSFNAFWSYPEEKNLSTLSEKLSSIKSPKELRFLVAQICALVFERNEEGSFLYTEAQNLLKYAEATIDKAMATASIAGTYIDISHPSPTQDTDKFLTWETAVTTKLCERYRDSLTTFTAALDVHEVQEHVKMVLFG
ncbi:hypothetical protein NEDG_01799 [Nematocida displodere]|uniref:Uncharacterized protein n=1 Tax=Nematocida displodere TaxID=1805483 RepID=A0A177EIL2_9MICR|nr:hypothetical protein NEDG_01799 [Nematocida displodere]